MIPEKREAVLDCASPSAFAARQSAAPARRRLALCKKAKDSQVFP